MRALRGNTDRLAMRLAWLQLLVVGTTGAAVLSMVFK